MGKTRFALELAGRIASGYPGGVCFVELQTVADPSLVPQALLVALGLGEEARQSADRTLIEHLRDRRMLLVLDNCEPVRDACADIVEPLLRHCADLRILATARVLLSVPGETTFRLTPLGEADAVDLFIERARTLLSPRPRSALGRGDDRRRSCANSTAFRSPSNWQPRGRVR